MILEITKLPLNLSLAIAYAVRILKIIEKTVAVIETTKLFIKYVGNFVFLNRFSYDFNEKVSGQKVGFNEYISLLFFIDVLNIQ